jgi:uncharacterized membrane protein YgcG
MAFLQNRFFPENKVRFYATCAIAAVLLCVLGGAVFHVKRAWDLTRQAAAEAYYQEVLNRYTEEVKGIGSVLREEELVEDWVTTVTCEHENLRDYVNVNVNIHVDVLLPGEFDPLPENENRSLVRSYETKMLEEMKRIRLEVLKPALGGIYDPEERTMDIRVGRKRYLLHLNLDTYYASPKFQYYYRPARGKKAESYFELQLFETIYGSSSGSSTGSSSGSSGGSSHGSSSGYTGGWYRDADPYDVHDFDDPDDFADEWADEFGDGDWEDGYDDAFDYWEENH